MSEERERFTGRDLTEALAAARKRYDKSRRELGFEIIEQPKIGPLDKIAADQVTIEAWVLPPDQVRPAPVRDEYERPRRGPREGRGGFDRERPERRPPREPRDEGPVTLPDLLPGSDVTESRAILEHLVGSLLTGLDMELAVGETTENEIGLRVNIDGPDASLLAGEGAEGLDALQYLVNRILNKHHRDVGRVSIDVGGHRARTEQELLDDAMRLVEEVRSTGEKRVMSPLPPFERRLIHLELAKLEDIKTFSAGHGYKRRLSIAPSGKD